MAGENLRGNKTLTGGHGKLWVDNELIAEFSAVTASITANRSDVQLGMSADSKITSFTGEGTLTLYKVYSRANKILKDWKKGNDTRSKIVFSILDPDAVGRQEERVSIDNVWFNTLNIINATKGEAISEEMPFGFTPEDVEYEGEIK